MNNHSHIDLIKGVVSRRHATAELTDERGVVDLRIDHDRADRCGFPEVVFAQGKTPEQVVRAVGELARHSHRVLVTRVNAEQVAAVEAYCSEFGWPLTHHEVARMLEIQGAPTVDAAESATEPEATAPACEPSPAVAPCVAAESAGVGLIVVATGGTSDIPVAEEAAITALAMGARVERLYDVGVAGAHRALEHTDLLREARVIIAVAGMEGALPTLVAGLVDVPVVAVPTSVGYGAHLDGFAPLLTMLNSCAGGIGVVNIDNGFGAAVLATRINDPSWARSTRSDH